MTSLIRYVTYTRENQQLLEFADLMCKAVGGPYELVMPPVEENHSEYNSSVWLATIVATKQADIGLLPVLVTEEDMKFVDFSYPLMMETIRFMIPKKTKTEDVFSVFRPFSFEAWIALLVSSLMMSFLLYALLRKKCQLSHILNNILCSLLQQSATFKIEREKWFMFTWLLGVFFLTCCYLSLLLSFLTFPPRNEVRDIATLAEQVRNGRYEVTTNRFFMATGLHQLLQSEDESIRIIGKSLDENPSRFEEFETFVYKEKLNRAFISTRNLLNKVQDRFFVSTDYFKFYPASFFVRKGFCCTEKLTTAIHRLTAAGFISRLMSFEDYKYEHGIKSHKLYKDNNDVDNMPLTLIHLKGAFIILGTGLSIAFLTLLVEIIVKHYEKR